MILEIFTCSEKTLNMKLASILMFVGEEVSRWKKKKCPVDHWRGYLEKAGDSWCACDRKSRKSFQVIIDFGGDYSLMNDFWKTIQLSSSVTKVKKEVMGLLHELRTLQNYTLEVLNIIQNNEKLMKLMNESIILYSKKAHLKAWYLQV